MAKFLQKTDYKAIMIDKICSVLLKCLIENSCSKVSMHYIVHLKYQHIKEIVGLIHWIYVYRQKKKQRGNTQVKKSS